MTDYTTDATFRILGLDHLVLRSADVDALRRFYVDVLGCSVEREQADLGLTQLRAGGSLIDLVTLDGPLGRAGGAGPGAQGRNLDHFCLRIDPFDAQALRVHLARHGVDAGEVAQRFGAEGKGPSLYVQDPDGNVVELKGPPTPVTAQ
ncbi:putative Glyoxalase/bleomycin resistance protein/dioxygenases superfamily [Cupriavidus taiwanensis]|uniref:VOC family protein n=1 Tax=Cupriavidus taiwanensis TaxID=164546 RepID=UPI000E124DEF|nr:VOC family protein [Cupriavidus taiwanensis]SOZ99273.1 putative Glyoxalase/bleomycin resistance protein/dioxygenases superfamily [Cupriavidus taiwanensis]SPA10221.1 putative Glyoxalase/bleomycin resistance protein/dioxygenases superfamily [Cupriavidus taiwanensis]